LKYPISKVHIYGEYKHTQSTVNEFKDTL